MTMLCIYAAFVLSLIAYDCSADNAQSDPRASCHAPIAAPLHVYRGAMVRVSEIRPEPMTNHPVFSTHRQRAMAQGEIAEKMHSTPTILGRWCNDHKEIWIFRRKTLTHRQPDNTHIHRVRYKRRSDRITVYVDGYPEEFLPLPPNGTRMKLRSSGLDSDMNGWLFWRCPNLLSSN